MLPWNNDTIVEKIDGCNRSRQITDFIQYKHSWNQAGIIVSNCDISLLQLLFCKSIVNLKEWVAAIVFLLLKKDHSSNGRLQLELRINSILFKYLSNTLYIRNGCKCSFKKYRIYWEMDGRSYFCEIKKHCTLKKSVLCE